jgi:GntR family transcriptional regulator, trigonelline degradation regulator
MQNSLSSLTAAREAASLRVKVVETLKDAILYGDFVPGQKLIERDLCDRLQISRPLLREALRQLQADGLIVNVLHKGQSVATLSVADARNIYMIRQALERLTGEEFARHATAMQVTELRACLASMRTNAIKKNPRALLQCKNRFYDLLAEGSGNPVVGQIMTMLRNRVTILRRFTLASPGRIVQSIKELEAIVKAIEARNPTKAGQMCAIHIGKAAEIAVASYGSWSSGAEGSSLGPVTARFKRRKKVGRSRGASIS